MTILHPRLTADETAATVQAVEAQVATHGGTLLSTDVWGRRRLAYPIHGLVDGTYVLSTFTIPPEGTAPLEAWLLLSENVLRHLLIRGIIPYAGHDREPERDREPEPADVGRDGAPDVFDAADAPEEGEDADLAEE